MEDPPQCLLIGMDLQLTRDTIQTVFDLIAQGKTSPDALRDLTLEDAKTLRDLSERALTTCKIDGPFLGLSETLLMNIEKNDLTTSLNCMEKIDQIFRLLPERPKKPPIEPLYLRYIF
jgi:hypothetical protein